MEIIGIDPGQSGAFVFLRETGDMASLVMPLNESKEIDFERVREILKPHINATIYLERAIPMAMGSKHAFNYGRGFAALEIAIRLSGLAVVYVEPTKWAKVMHEGISSDLKPKAKSLIAVKRLFPALVGSIPASKTGKLHEGIIDALLIAGFGLRERGGNRTTVSINDF